MCEQKVGGRGRIGLMVNIIGKNIFVLNNGWQSNKYVHLIHFYTYLFTYIILMFCIVPLHFLPNCS